MGKDKERPTVVFYFLPFFLQFIPQLGNKQRVSKQFFYLTFCRKKEEGFPPFFFFSLITRADGKQQDIFFLFRKSCKAETNNTLLSLPIPKWCIVSIELTFGEGGCFFFAYATFEFLYGPRVYVHVRVETGGTRLGTSFLLMGMVRVFRLITVLYFMLRSPFFGGVQYTRRVVVGSLQSMTSSRC